MRVAIVGFGRFGRLFAKLLADHHGSALRLVAASRTNYAPEARVLGVEWVSIAEAARSEVVILCVPMRELGGVLDQIAPALRPGALVMDTCSVKVVPSRLMSAKLPASVDLLATHPMFGPDSVRQLGVAGQRLVLCPIRVGPQRLALVAGWFEAMGIKILRLTPEEHDRQAALSQGLVHFIGRAVAQAGFQEPAVTTANAGRLFELSRLVMNDSPVLFHDLESLNPFAAGVRRAFLDAARAIEAELEQAGDDTGEGN